LSQLAVSYGANAIPAMGGTTDSSRIKFQNAAVPAIGSGYALATETVVDEHIGCAGVTKVGEPCKARKANGTDWCVGHLRSRGEL
jgi:hypothetical protein